MSPNSIAYERLLKLLDPWQDVSAWFVREKAQAVFERAQACYGNNPQIPNLPPPDQTRFEGYGILKAFDDEWGEIQSLVNAIAPEMSDRLRWVFRNYHTPEKMAELIHSVRNELVKQRERFGIRRFGSVVEIDGYKLELTNQLAELLELAFEDGGLPFDEARKHFRSWKTYQTSQIRARVAALNNKLLDATTKAPFTIIVNTKSKRITPEFIVKTQAIEKLSQR